MTGSDGPSFVDTNILICAFEAEASPKGRAAKRLVLELTRAGRPRISSQVIQELYGTLVRKLKVSPRDALEYLDRLSGWYVWKNGFVETREAAVLSERAVLSFWDALIIVSASRSGAAVLYTEDLNHTQVIEGVRIVNPFVES